MSTDVATPSVQAAAFTNARHRIHLKGACSVNGGADAACTAIGVSLDGLIVETATPVAFLDEAIVNLPHLGIVEAIVAEVFDGGFELRFEPAPQSKLGIFVAWIEGVTVPVGAVDRERRAHERIVPIKRLTTLTRDGEPPSLVRIVDLSRSGAAFTTSKALTEGERVRVGALAGEIVRLIDGGAAVRFDHMIAERDFDALIDLDMLVDLDVSTDLAASSEPAGYTVPADGGRAPLSQ